MLERLFAALARSAARRSLPSPTGEVRLPGLAGEVRVIFGEAAVPHVLASGEADLFFAQGWLHARERLWQMELTRRVVAGRLAEAFGDAPVDWRDLTIHLRGAKVSDVDFFMRVLGLRKAAAAAVDLLDERSREALEAYARGVNAWIASRPRRRLPVELRLVHLQPEPWTPVDSLSVVRGMAYELNVSWKVLVLQQAVAASVPPELRDELAPDGYGPADPSILELLELDATAREFVGWRGSGVGSNSWALAGRRTLSGHPILCNDPHLRLRSPGIWYLAHLRGGDYDVVGATMPGVPGVIIGRNRRIAVGLTNAMLHDADLFEERLRGDAFEVNGEWRPLEVEVEIIRVRGGGVRRRRVRRSRHGPLLTDALVGHPAREDRALALRWTAHDPSAEIPSILAVNRARSGAEVREALRQFGCPAQNVVYADADGQVGYQFAGRIPLRRGRPPHGPVPGWTDDHEWVGTVPFEEQPHLEDPEDGLVATANNQVVDGSYPHYLSAMWEPPFRIRRIRQVLEARERHGPEDMAALQADDLHLEAVDFLEEVLRPAAGEVVAAGLSTLGAHALDRLLQWDGRCGVDSVAATLFHGLYERLLHRLLGRRLPEPLFWAVMEHFSQPGATLRQILRRPESAWWRPEGRAAGLAAALDEAVRVLQGRLGPFMEEWRWGRLHQVEMVHAMGVRPLTRRFFNGSPLPTPGSSGTVNVGQFFYTRPFAHAVGAGYRQVVDFAPEGASWFVAATGQSGHPVSPHYRDQTELWRQARYLGMSLEIPDGPGLRLLPS